MPEKEETPTKDITKILKIKAEKQNSRLFCFVFQLNSVPLHIISQVI